MATVDYFRIERRRVTMVGADPARVAVQAIIANHPDVVVRDGASQQVTFKYCKFAQDAYSP